MRRSSVLGLAAVFAAATAVGLWVVRPLAVHAVGPDAAAPVIEFERLLAAQRLEGHLSQTSKPLLTLIYGAARLLTGGWWSVSLLAVGSYALFAALAAFLADRLAGRAAGAFVAVAVVLSPVLIEDVASAYGVSWAVLGCVIAGIAVSGQRPRFGLAGLALAAGALARPEVLAVTAFAVGWVVLAHLVAFSGRVPRPPRRAWLLAIGLAAIAILWWHDWALTGDGLFWLNSAQANTSAARTKSLAQVARLVAVPLTSQPLVGILAALGVVDLLRRRRWLGAILVTTVPAAVVLFYGASGVRGTELFPRYLVPASLGVVLAAGVGIGTFDGPRLRRVADRVAPALRNHGVAAAALALALGAIGALLVAPRWPSNALSREGVALVQQRAANMERALAVIAGELGTVPEWRGTPVPVDATPIVLLPPHMRAQVIVDLDLPLWAGVKSLGGVIRPAVGRPRPGTIVYHDTTDDHPSSLWHRLQVSVPTVVGRLRFVPLFTDPAAGIWILRTEPAGTQAGGRMAPPG